MGIEENKAAARQLVDEYLNGRNVAVVDELTSEDFVDHQGGVGVTGGRQDLKEFIGGFLSSFEDLQFEAEHLVAEDEFVCIHLVARGTHTGEFQGIPATGKPVTIGGISMVRYDNEGRMAERWNVVDIAGLLRQIRS